MRSLLVAFALLLALPAWAQIDIPIGSVGPVISLGRNLQWQSSGRGGLLNNWIIVNTIPNQGFCIYLQNHTSALHTVIVTAASTGDQNVTGLISQPNAWTAVPTSLPDPTNNTLRVPEFGAASFFAYASAAAKFAVSFRTSTGGAGTVDLMAVATNFSGCQGNSTLVSAQTGSTPMRQCNGTQILSVPPGEAVSIVGPGDPRTFYFCEAAINQPQTPTTAVPSGFATSNTGICTPGPALSAVYYAGGMVAGTVVIGGNLGYFLRSPQTGLCFVNNNIGGGTIQVSVTVLQL